LEGSGSTEPLLFVSARALLIAFERVDQKAVSAFTDKQPRFRRLADWLAADELPRLQCTP